MPTPRVSIVIPAYKSKYLKEAIDSVLKQTFEDFELLILDDSSPENIWEIVDQFSDPRLTYHRNKVNIGGANLVSMWNKCLDLASGDFFILFSDDDLYHPRFLESLVCLADRHPSFALFRSRVCVIDEFGDLLHESAELPELETGLDFVKARLLDGRRQFAPEFMASKTSLVESGGFVEFPLAWCSDDATWIKLAQVGGVASTVEALCSWRWSRINISRIGALEPRLQAVNLFVHWMHELLACWPTRTTSERETLRLIQSKLSDVQVDRHQDLLFRCVSVQILFFSCFGFGKLPIQTTRKAIVIALLRKIKQLFRI
jgi:glycosyltransferase involved in cell wall biosynthesis